MEPISEHGGKAGICTTLSQGIIVQQQHTQLYSSVIVVNAGSQGEACAIARALGDKLATTAGIIEVQRQKTDLNTMDLGNVLHVLHAYPEITNGAALIIREWFAYLKCKTKNGKVIENRNKGIVEITGYTSKEVAYILKAIKDSANEERAGKKAP